MGWFGLEGLPEKTQRRLTGHLGDCGGRPTRAKRLIIETRLGTPKFERDSERNKCILDNFL